MQGHLSFRPTLCVFQLNSLPFFYSTPPSTTLCVLTGCPHASLLGAAGVLDVTLHQTPLHPLCYVCAPVCVCQKES